MNKPRLSQIRPEGSPGQYPKVDATGDGWDYDTPGGAPTIEDEGTALGPAGTLNFTGAGVTATETGGVATITIPGGDGLSDPTTTKGDLIVRGASAIDRLPVGSDGYGLLADSSQTDGVRWGLGYSFPKVEDFTAGGGETTLTFGATPIGDPLIFKNNLPLKETTDYTLSGTIVTFTTVLAAGDKIKSLYSTLGSAPPPSSLGGIITSPSTYAGLQVWLKPEAITGLNNQDPVASWPDSSGNGNNMAASGTNRPVWESAPFVDNKGGVRFTYTSNQYMQLASNTAVDLTGDLAIFAVVRFTTVSKGSTSQNTVLSKDYTRYELYEYQSLEASYIGGTANPANSASGALAATTVYLLELHRASGAVTLFKNAVQQASATNTASNTGTYPLTLGNRASALTSGNALNGDLLEVFIYNQARSSTEKTNLRSYIANRWPSIGL